MYAWRARPKRQRLRTNIPALRDLSVLCDGGHEHAPWVTNLGETRFFFTQPRKRNILTFCCARVAARVAWALSGSSKSPQQLRVFQLKAKLAAQRRLNSAVAGRQARSDSAQLIPEFKRIVTLACPSSCCPSGLLWLSEKKTPSGIDQHLSELCRIMDAKALEENGEMDEVPEVLSQYGRHRRSSSLLRTGVDCELKVGSLAGH